jgi:signal transduction histidine kinase
MDSLHLVVPESKEMINERYFKRLDGQEVPRVTQAEFLSKEGKIKHLEISAGLIEYENRNAVLVVARDITERRDYEKRLRNLSEQIIRTQEEERKRISHELHDEIGQTLTAINLNVGLLRRQHPVGSASHPICEDIQGLVTKIVDDIHRISYNLRPYVLDNLGLVPALKWWTTEFQKRTGIKARFQAEGEVQNGFSPVEETFMFRFAQEALTNVLKHAEAANVFVSISCRSNKVKMVIQDDGKGFDAENLSSYSAGRWGMGLFGIKERALGFDGTFHIISALQKGTALIVELPCVPLEAEEKGSL